MPENYEELLKPRDVTRIFDIATIFNITLIKAIRLPTGKLRYPRVRLRSCGSS